MEGKERPRYKSRRLQEKRARTGERGPKGEQIFQTGEGTGSRARRDGQTLEGYVRQGERAPRTRTSRNGQTGKDYQGPDMASGARGLKVKAASMRQRSQGNSGANKPISQGERRYRNTPARKNKKISGDMPAWERRKKGQNNKGRQVLRRLVFAVPAILILFILFTLFRPGPFSDASASAGNFNFPVSLPWDKGKGTVMLDAGHGGRDQGTSYEDVLEKDLTLEITLKVEDILEDAGYRVLLTRSKDTFIDKYERVASANDKKPEVFVSIHCNFVESGQADGVETYYDPGKEAGSRPLAEAVQAQIIEKTGATDRGARADNFVVITDTDMPAVLVETGFLSDQEERRLLQDEAYQKKLAEGIAAGILKYLEAPEEGEV